MHCHLSDDGNAANGAPMTVACSGQNMIDARGHAAPFAVATIPDIGATRAAPTCHQHACRVHNAHIRIVTQSINGDRSRIVGGYRIGIGAHHTFLHLFSGIGSIGNHSA